MAEQIDYIKRRVDAIYTELQTLRRVQLAELRAKAEEMEPRILSFFRGQGASTLAACYVSADGARTQQEIADLLGVSKATVSRCMAKLEDQGFLEAVPADSANVKVYKQNPAYEEVFNLSVKLVRQFDLPSS